MAGVLDQHRLGAAAYGLAQRLHHRQAQHRVLRAHGHKAAPGPFGAPELARPARHRRTVRVGKLGHHRREGAQRSPVSGIGKRRHVGGAFALAHVRVAARKQAGHVELGVFRAHRAPGQEAGAQRLLAGRQHGVHGQQACITRRGLHRQGQPEQAAPVLHHQHDVVQVEPLHQFQQHVAMPGEAVGRVLLGFVALAETDQVGRHDTVPGCQEYRDHLAVEVTPGRIAVQAQPRQRRISRAFVEVMHAQAAERRQVAQVMRLPRVTGQVGEPGLGRPQRVFAQRAAVHAGLLTSAGKKGL